MSGCGCVPGLVYCADMQALLVRICRATPWYIEAGMALEMDAALDAFNRHMRGMQGFRPRWPEQDTISAVEFLAADN